MDEQDGRTGPRTRGPGARNHPTNQVGTWENPDTGHSYSMTPRRTYQQDSQPCRDYTTEAVIDGQKETVSGTVCRQPDGAWQATNCPPSKLTESGLGAGADAVYTAVLEVPRSPA